MITFIFKHDYVWNKEHHVCLSEILKDVRACIKTNALRPALLGLVHTDCDQSESRNSVFIITPHRPYGPAVTSQSPRICCRSSDGMPLRDPTLWTADLWQHVWASYSNRISRESNYFTTSRFLQKCTFFRKVSMLFRGPRNPLWGVSRSYKNIRLYDHRLCKYFTTI